MSINCRAYCRVSTTLQSQEGCSLEAQEQRIRDYCNYKRVNLIKVYSDPAYSGKDSNRPALQQLLNEVREGESIIVYDLSRFTRVVRDALNMFNELENKGVNFVCLNPELDFSTPHGRAYIIFNLTINQLEREYNSQRISNTMQHLSKQGKLRTLAPFGYKFVDKTSDMIEEPEQQKVLEKIKTMYKEGMNFNKIAKKLNESGDNKCIINNKKKTTSIPKFYCGTIKNILIDHGLVKDDKIKRPSLEQRIKCHRANVVKDKSSVNNIIELEIIPSQDITQNKVDELEKLVRQQQELIEKLTVIHVN
jgi:DNA invertase Pin-like site-specific DNA recombinase